MATFQIHQDAEKENPRQHFVLKEKASHKPLQASTMLGAGGTIVGGGGLKEKQQIGIRSNFATLKGNANNGNVASRIVGGGGGGTKMAFREVVSNLKAGGDENVAANSFAAAATAAAAKKSTVVPVVEQFKTFSVYEDNSQESVVVVAQNQQQHVAATSSVDVVDKENVFVEHQHRRPPTTTQVDMKSDSLLHKDFGCHEDDYILDTTPMSVSDVLSPMSVDRSQITASSTSHLADSSELIVDVSSSRQASGVQRLPRNDRERFFEVVEYQHAILEYFRESEKKHRPKPHYMRRQSDINYSMRTILVDWLVEVSEEYNLDTETLYLSVSYIDRFLSHMSVVRSKLQLVGTAAMYIASKYEEIFPPDVGEFVFITDDTYNKAQVLRMEQIILKILAFDLCTPTAYVFINTYAVLTDMPDKVKFLTQYICELSLLEADPYLRFHPSIISAAAFALARHLLDYPIWSPELQEITAYHLKDLKEVFMHLCKTHNAATTLAQQAIQEKYKAEKYEHVSTVKAVELTEELFDEISSKYDDLSAATVGDNSDEHQSTATTSNENVRRMISLMFN